MLPHIQKKLQDDAIVVAEQLETTFGTPAFIGFDEVCDGCAITLKWRRMGFRSGKTYIVTLTLDDGGL